MSGGSALSSSVLGRSALIICLCAGQAWAAEMYGPVKPGEGVYAVARQFRDAQSELNLRQWALAIFAANRESFGPGPDELRAGSRLMVPSEAEAAELWRYGSQLEQGMRYEDLAQQINLVLQPRRVALAPQVPAVLGAPAAAPAEGPPNSTSVAPGEGIYAVAARYRDRRKDLSLHKWAWAIYAANPEAFSAGLDSLRSGSRLRIPSEAQVRELWLLGKKIEDGRLTRRTAAAQVDEVLATVPATETPDSAFTQAAAAEQVRPGEAPTPEPYFFWFVPGQERATAPEPVGTPGEVAGPAPDTAEPPAEAPAPTAVAALPGGQAEQDAFADTELYQRALAASGGGNVLGVLAELREVEDRYSGDPDFDYVFGVLLLDAGEPQEAIYPLQRASQQRPGALGTRLDLGRAYFESGENESARLIFNQLAQRDPPPTAALVIASYRDAIQRRAGRYERRLATQLGFSAGFDSNANSATSLTEFAGFFLDDAARSTESGYAQASAATQLSNPLGPRLSWLLGANVLSRQYADAQEFSNSRWAVASGLSYRRGNSIWDGLLSGGQTFVDGRNNHDFAALTAGLRQRASEFWVWRIGAKAGLLRYADELQVRDVDQLLLTTGASRRFNWAFGSELGLELAVGQDEAVQDNSPFGRDLVGVSFTSAIQLRPAVRLNFAGHYLEADYDGSFVGSQRKDEQLFTDLSLELTHNRWKNWSVELLSRYVNNTSSVELYDHDRLDLGLGLTWLLE